MKEKHKKQFAVNRMLFTFLHVVQVKSLFVLPI